MYNKLIKLAKRNYYSKRLSETTHDMKKTWNLLREIIMKTNKKCSFPTKLNVSDDKTFSLQLEDNTQIVEFFNSYFASVGERTATLIEENVNTDPLDYLNDVNIDHSFFLSPTDANEVITTALNIKSKQSTGFDGISNSLIKQIIYHIAEPLAHIFNLSFNSGICPDIHKIAKIIPILISGDKTNPVNFRPISLLPAFSKILEKLTMVQKMY